MIATIKEEKHMFKSGDNDKPGSFIADVFDSFFPIDINSNDSVLKIDDKRFVKYVNVIGIGLIAAILLIYLSRSFFLEWGLLVANILVFVILAIISAIVFFLLSRVSYRRISIFNRKENTYQIIRLLPFRVDKEVGKLNEIKYVQIDVTVYSDTDESSTNYLYQTFLVLSDSIVYDNSNMLAVEEKPGSYDSSAKVAFAISEFLQLPNPKENILSEYS